MKRIVSIICLAALLVSVLSMTAFAEGSENYGFNKGKSENESRHSVYGQLGHTDEQVDRSGYVDSHVNSDAAISTLNTDALVESGIIDQETADKITSFAATKHTDISAIYDGLDSMTPAQRNEAFAARKKADATQGDTVTELVSAGIITQEQADAISAFLAK